MRACTVQSGVGNSLGTRYAARRGLLTPAPGTASARGPTLARAGGEQEAATTTTDDAPLRPQPPSPQQQQQPEKEAQQQQEQERPKQRRQADSTDAVASFLTRRFGIAGGLAWLGVLAVGSLGEQVKTRMEVAAEKEGTRDVQGQEVVLPSGVRYTDERVGGGQAPSKGLLVVLSYVGRADGAVFEDTRARGKPIVYLYGGRPFTGGLCAGVEEALATMRAGGKRRVVVPPALGFGDRGAVLRPTEHVPEKQGVIPPGATLEYDIELQRVSIPPS
ncbi:hypothetical protein MNEG_11234 [Monoraphidium neglectum]|uniref:peptidylprolyl isomerase n=1 Tax=Monoraphidium neglectum TaxID=145388 RepID=A0A0D2JAF8_9CHLO|nr:hypothetical protein MNEG_11234 [Monoraphidium neglectum]KIY96727.1 hypothetical protein MNEG_11234 [Monoraphidium neglectum]|eukprot:XP_013895747.1 hypothetical protein MNEG_11234 [Monoraphidium neglectum]